MIKYERQQNIVSILKERRFATVAELAGEVWASEASVRRDIEWLEKQGYVNKIYGGVVLAEYKNSVVPVELRASAYSPEKELVAKRAAEYVFDGATIIMDGSSTVRRICKHLAHGMKLKIFTNNQQIFTDLADRDLELYCTGGRFDPETRVFVGTAAEHFLRGISADILFFSSQAISERGEISDVSETETSIRRVMMERARKKIFLCDSSKFGLVKPFTLCTKDEVDVILCDRELELS